ncbi:condensation domain-containing protein, partial [Methylocucumis oryzae]|uniref:condensation domain-containing protein n=1 Tax=Methylocucumis oryzae TaxID=1632867 RepID=UPI001038B464
MREFDFTPLNQVQRWWQQGSVALFDTLLVFENYPVASVLQQTQGELVFSGEFQQERAYYPLTLAVQAGDALSISFDYDRQFFSDSVIEQLVTVMRELLLQMQAKPEHCLAQLSIAVDDWASINATSDGSLNTGFIASHSVHQRIHMMAQSQPNAIALIDGETRLSYGELERQSNRLAHSLQHSGLKP